MAHYYTLFGVYVATLAVGITQSADPPHANVYDEFDLKNAFVIPLDSDAGDGANTTVWVPNPLLPGPWPRA